MVALLQLHPRGGQGWVDIPGRGKALLQSLPPAPGVLSDLEPRFLKAKSHSSYPVDVKDGGLVTDACAGR